MRSPMRLCCLTCISISLAVTTGLGASADLPVYSDTLLSGFQDRVWQSHNLLSTSTVHAGSASISVAPAEFWEGLYLHHPGLDTSGYESLSFWVNGGSSGGQWLQVQALVGENNPSPDVYFRFTAPTNHWQQIIVPLEALGAAHKTNLTGIWIQLTPGGTSNLFYVDDVRFNAAPPARLADLVPGILPAPGQGPASGMKDTWNTAVWIIVAVLLQIAVLLTWLVVMLRRSGLGRSSALVRRDVAFPELSLPVLQALADPQAQQLRDKLASDLAEFAKQSLVQGLYSQRSQLMETQRKAELMLSELETRLASLRLPLEERVRAYETRIGELEQQLETRDDEMRDMIQATLLLVRERLEQEKANNPHTGRFN